mgnify:CR=1 FL=1
MHIIVQAAKLRIRKKPKASEGAGTSAAARQQAFEGEEWSDDDKARTCCHAWAIGRYVVVPFKPWVVRMNPWKAQRYEITQLLSG